MTTTIKKFSKMLLAFVLCAGFVLTSCETAAPVDDSKDSGDTETPSNIIVFADDIVKKSCVEAFDTDGDGEISYDEAAVVKDLSDVNLRFKNDFLTFDEFQYFTNVKFIPDRFFQGCKYLKSIMFPESLRSIGYLAFVGCNSLIKIELPESVENVDAAFFSCANLKTVYCKPLTPPTFHNSMGVVFDEVKLEHIYVPMESVELYKDALFGYEDKIVGYYF